MIELGTWFQKLYPFLSDDNQKPSEFMDTLFGKAMNEGSIVPALTPEYLQRIYNANGRNKLSCRNAKYILTRLNYGGLGSYIYEQLDEDDLIELCGVFQDEIGNTTKDVISDKIEGLFIAILRGLSSGVNTKKQSNMALPIGAMNTSIEQELANIIRKLSTLTEKELTAIADLSLNPVAVGTKIKNNDRLKKEILDDVFQYFQYIKSLLNEAAKTNSNFCNRLAETIKSRSEYYTSIKQTQGEVFDELINWLKVLIPSNDTIACKAIISFFVQNCEVFTL